MDARNPLGPPPVQPPPLGWLGFLGIKSGGRQPGQTNPTLSPVYDMFEHYLAGQRINLVPTSVVVAAAANAPSLIATVPQGKCWVVCYAQAIGPQGAVAALGNASIALSQPSGFVYYRGPPSGVPVTLQSMLARMDKTQIMGPGDRISVFTEAGNAFTAFNYTCSVSGLEVSA